MITTHTLRVTSEVDKPLQLYLAPYGLEELTRCVPENPLPFSTGVYLSAPEDAYMADEQAPHTVSWGYYAGKPSVETFAGKVHLSEEALGNPGNQVFTKVVQAVGLLAMAPDKRGKGFESLAIMTIVRNALEVDGTKAFVAETPEHNLGSHEFLAAAGFTHTSTHARYTLPGGELTYYWVLAHPDAYGLMPQGKGSSADQMLMLQAGWDRYLDVSRRLKLENL